jgi:methylmalonyl-CoA mutase C-terminal domain/subunit
MRGREGVCGELLILAKSVIRHTQVLTLLRERGAGRIPVVLGGTLPFEDMPRLEALGIRAVFPAGTPAVEFQEKIRELAAGRQQRL